MNQNDEVEISRCQRDEEFLIVHFKNKTCRI